MAYSQCNDCAVGIVAAITYAEGRASALCDSQGWRYQGRRLHRLRRTCGCRLSFHSIVTVISCVPDVRTLL